MIPTSVESIAHFCGGKLVSGDSGVLVTALSTDTRKLADGDLFVALVGDRFDAHDFLVDASKKAAVCMVSRLPVDFESFDCAFILVADTLIALQELAKGYRRKHLSMPVVCVTGSNGKTSTKDFLRSVLGAKFCVNATKGNFNNHIGLPLTILETDSQHDCGVWEIGMSNPGEIQPLVEIAQPNVGVITNVGTAHIEHMGTREAIAKEKGELAAGIPENGFVVLNALDDFTPAIRERCSARVVTAGIETGDVRASNLDLRGDGSCFDVSFGEGSSFQVEIPVPGKHMVSNALLAIAVALEFEFEPEAISQAIEHAELTKGRLQLRKVNGVSIIDDSYNANPDSMRAAFAALQNISCEGKRIAALGKMAELGESSLAEHKALGRDAAVSFGIDRVVTVGSDAAEIARGFLEAGGDLATECEDHESCREILESLSQNDLVLVKGSRSAEMEKVIPLEAP